MHIKRADGTIEHAKGDSPEEKRAAALAEAAERVADLEIALDNARRDLARLVGWDANGSPV